MRQARPILNAAFVAAVLMLDAAAPAAAGGSGVRPGRVDLSWAGLGLPPAADSNKPKVTPFDRLAPVDPATCIPELPCGTRLYGTLDKHSAVEVQVPAWRW